MLSIAKASDNSIAYVITAFIYKPSKIQSIKTSLFDSKMEHVDLHKHTAVS